MAQKTKINKLKRPRGRPRIHPIRGKLPVGRPSNKAIKEPRTIGKQIEMMVACKMSQAEISKALGMSEEELKSKYADELRLGPARFEAELLDMIWESANRGNAQALRLLNTISRQAQNGQRKPPLPKLQKLGKKAQRQAEAEAVKGKYDSPSTPKLVVDNSKKKPPKR